VEIRPQVVGGEQEEGRRAGTENVPAIVGLAKALTLVKKSDSARVAKLRDYFLKHLPDAVPDARVNGPVGKWRLANNVNISIPGTDSENILLELDRRGIRAASGSACTAHSVQASHVLKAIRTPKEYLMGALRFSFSRRTTRSEVNFLLEILPNVVARARKRYLK
jgi:cysteine desulfurase